MTDPVREFIRAFNERDLDAFVAVLDPEVELHASRGLRKGREAARVWATRKAGGVQQTIELEQLYEDGTEGGGGRAVALIRRRWHWAEDDSEAGVEEMAWAFELRNHKVLSWHPCDDRAEALRAGGFLPGTSASRGGD
ncbi:MAG TPA: nuclear transport factor 2 family protein [Solirubrobacterales bacterium]|nr:nuclear transport factor 2 family protein [Solirubrobacterales bacterium]